MAFGAADTERDRTALPLGSVAIYLVGVAALAFCITLLWLGMRAVMDLGGFCASGGPYVIAVECPDAVLATTPLSILGGFLAAGLVVWGGAALGGSWMSLVFLAWPALFLSLGWNFLEYGFFPARRRLGVELALLRRAVRADGRRAVGPGDRRASCGGRGRPVLRVRSRGRPPEAHAALDGGHEERRPPEATPASVPGSSPSTTTPSDEPLVDRLERLAAMRRRGDLTSEEFETAKAATLAEAGGRP